MTQFPYKIRFFSAVEPGWSYYRDLLPFLVKEGAQVELVISTNVYRDGRENLTQVLEDQGVVIKQIPASSFGFSGKYGKVLVYASYIVGALLHSLFGRHRDLNVFLTQPPLFSLWGYALKLLRRQKFAIVVMDIYPDVAIQGGLIDDNSVFTRMSRFLSRLTLKRSDRLIAIGRCMAAYLENMGVAPERIRIVHNWSNEQVFPVQHKDNHLRSDLGLENDFVILYSGNIGLSHFFDDILTVATRLKEYNDIKFVFIGDGVRLKEIEEQKSARNLDNVLLLPFQPVESLAYSLGLGDLHFISLRDGFAGLVVPSKTYSTLAAGRPVLFQGPETSEIARLVRENDVGTVIPLGKPELLRDMICKYYHTPQLVHQQGLRALALASGLYGRENALEKYRDAFWAIFDHSTA